MKNGRTVLSKTRMSSHRKRHHLSTHSPLPLIASTAASSSKGDECVIDKELDVAGGQYEPAFEECGQSNDLDNLFYNQ